MGRSEVFECDLPKGTTKEFTITDGSKDIFVCSPSVRRKIIELTCVQVVSYHLLEVGVNADVSCKYFTFSEVFNSLDQLWYLMSSFPTILKSMVLHHPCKFCIFRCNESVDCRSIFKFNFMCILHLSSFSLIIKVVGVVLVVL